MSTSKRLGVLLLHGFTSSLKSVDGLVPLLKKEKIPFEMPVLAGHGRTPAFLVGVTYRDWIEDAEKALLALLERVDRVVVVGLSMGGLVSLELGIRHPEVIAGVVAVAPAMRFANPLAPFAPFLKRLISTFPSPNPFVDKTLRKGNTNYPHFPVSTFASLYEFSRMVEGKLAAFDRPLVILQHRKMQVTHPHGATLILKKVASSQKKILWFERSGHEMMQDCEAKAVLSSIMSAIRDIKRGDLNPC